MANNKIAVTIPLYREVESLSDRFSINHNLKILKKREIIFIAPYRLKDWLEGFIKNFSKNNVKTM
jgi:hypothetical protein